MSKIFPPFLSACGSFSSVGGDLNFQPHRVVNAFFFPPASICPLSSLMGLPTKHEKGPVNERRDFSLIRLAECASPGYLIEKKEGKVSIVIGLILSLIIAGESGDKLDAGWTGHLTFCIKDLILKF